MEIFKKPTLTEKVKDSGKKIEPEIIDVFFGRKNIFVLLSFIIGGVFIGNSLFAVLSQNYGYLVTFDLGLALFTIGGILNQSFKR